MGKTVVSLIIPFTFASEGKYKVSINNSIADIEITYVQSNEVIDRIKGIVSVGKSALMPDDPEGVVNISKVVLELPFQYSLPNDQANESSERSGPIKEVCVSSLNRLRDVIRFCTLKYWIRPISPQQLTIYNIETYDDNGKGRQLFIFFESPSQSFFPLAIKENKDVDSQITEMLSNEKEISLAETLYFDSLNFFHFFSFREAIITANIALEVFVWSHWIEKFVAEGISIDKADKLVANLFDGGLQKAFKKKYFGSLNKEARSKHDIWIKLLHVRNVRKNVIHPHTSKPSPEKTRQVLLDIPIIISWMLKQT